MVVIWLGFKFVVDSIEFLFWFGYGEEEVVGYGKIRSRRFR